MISHIRLLELLSYSPETGEFTWLKDQYRAKAGTIAGCLSRKGTIWEQAVICVDGWRVYRGRLAWFYVTKEWPTVEIDHKDCNRLNDRFDNLRESTRSENQCNTRRYKNNETGFKGVFFEVSKNKFRAHIQKNNKRVSVGNFDTAEEAFKARQKLLGEFHGAFARVA